MCAALSCFHKEAVFVMGSLGHNGGPSNQ
uniref:Uncharacterized protein n=1 Tax=Rhizophora mucronata TaxID=61149 RepID=A0A2P2PGV2_RHIMU